MRATRSTRRHSLLASAALFTLVGCGTKANVDVDVNGNTGDDIQEAFFGVATLDRQPVTFSEDIDFDGNLDVNEDIDGDGNLDFFDEDQNGNGVIDEVPVDINGDGVADENDVFSASVVILFGTSGEINCDDIAAALENQEEPPFDGTLLTASAISTVIGEGAEGLIESGSVLENVEDELRTQQVSVEFARFENSVPVEGSEASSENNITFTVDKLEETLSVSLDGALVDEDGAEFPLSATFKRVEECKPLSDFLAQSLLFF